MHHSDIIPLSRSVNNGWIDTDRQTDRHTYAHTDRWSDIVFFQDYRYRYQHRLNQIICIGIAQQSVSVFCISVSVKTQWSTPMQIMSLDIYILAHHVIRHLSSSTSCHQTSFFKHIMSSDIYLLAHHVIRHISSSTSCHLTKQSAGNEYFSNASVAQVMETIYNTYNYFIFGPRCPPILPFA